MQELFCSRDSKSEGKILATITAGPSPPPVVAETVMSDTSVSGVRLVIEKLVLLVVCSN